MDGVNLPRTTTGSLSTSIDNRMPFVGLRYIINNGRGNGLAGTIMVWPGIPSGTPDTRVPANWFLCEGQYLVQSSYPALFNLIQCNFGCGTVSGGPAFRLPDMRGRVAAHTGNYGVSYATPGGRSGNTVVSTGHTHGFATTTLKGTIGSNTIFS